MHVEITSKFGLSRLETKSQSGSCGFPFRRSFAYHRPSEPPHEKLFKNCVYFFLSSLYQYFS